MARQDDSLVGVVNSTPLIALSIVGRLGLLRNLFDELFIPASVHEEVVRGGQGRPGAKEVAQAAWLTVQKPKETIPLSIRLFSPQPFGSPALDNLSGLPAAKRDFSSPPIAVGYISQKGTSWRSANAFR